MVAVSYWRSAVSQGVTLHPPFQNIELLLMIGVLSGTGKIPIIGDLRRDSAAGCICQLLLEEVNRISRKVIIQFDATVIHSIINHTAVGGNQPCYSAVLSVITAEMCGGTAFHGDDAAGRQCDFRSFGIGTHQSAATQQDTAEIALRPRPHRSRPILAEPPRSAYRRCHAVRRHH